MKINAIRVYDHFINLIPHGAADYGELFKIDSVSLLLGTNGSGKTRILTSLANAIGSPQDDAIQFYFEGTPNGHIEPQSPYNKHLCAIYYSALPYKRKISRRKGIINASPNNKTLTDDNRLENFKVISEVLQINTQLECVISYSKMVFRTILIPLLRNFDKVANATLGFLLKDLARLGSGPDKISHIHLSAYDIDKKRELILNNIEEIIEDEMIFKLGRQQAFLYLSSMEYMYSKEEKKTKSIALELLGYIGFVYSERKKTESFDFYELKKLVGKTDSLIDIFSNSKETTWGFRRLSFKIKNLDESYIIKSANTPIRIEWSNQSSGLQALVEQLSSIDDAVRKAAEKKYTSVLLLIDEGDAYLHLDWQRKYISILNDFLGGVKKKYDLDNMQLVLATHSPLLAADIPGDYVISLDSKDFPSTFAAPIEEVILNAFSSNSLGEFAAAKINEIFKRAESKKTTKFDKNLVNSIGDISIRSALKRKIKDDN